MIWKKATYLILTWALVCSCVYIVLPEEEGTPTSASGLSSNGWTAMVTKVSQTDAGDLRVELAIENETGNWSIMHAVAGKPATLTESDGKTSACDVVFMGTGGHSLAPGFRMRGYTGGTKKEPKTQPLYVECKGVKAAAGQKVSIPYTYTVGDFDFHIPAVPVNTTMELDLGKVVTDVSYPVATGIPGLIVKAGDKIGAMNNFTLTLTEVKRTSTGLEFKWQDFNPSEYPNYIHIGVPPVIGSDGIIYGFFESPDIADATITLPGQTADWITNVLVPSDVTGLYILVSVESKQANYFIYHVIDITNQ